MSKNNTKTRQHRTKYSTYMITNKLVVDTLCNSKKVKKRHIMSICNFNLSISIFVKFFYTVKCKDTCYILRIKKDRDGHYLE